MELIEWTHWHYRYLGISILLCDQKSIHTYKCLYVSTCVCIYLFWFCKLMRCVDYILTCLQSQMSYFIKVVTLFNFNFIVSKYAMAFMYTYAQQRVHLRTYPHCAFDKHSTYLCVGVYLNTFTYIYTCQKKSSYTRSNKLIIKDF